MNDILIDSIRLIRSENIGVRTFFDLIRLYNSPSNAVLELAKNKLKFNLCLREEVLTEIKKVTDYGGRILSYFDNNYPVMLKKISDPPPVISAIGNLDLLDKRQVAIVGSRNATINGCRMAYKLSKEITKHGFCITSGLARGIDTAAHKGAENYQTIAVIANGLDQIYPAENTDLQNIIKDKGLILSEFPFGTAPKAQNFPRRNRIIAGLSDATIVVEATLKSGSLITANYALEENRDVFAVPGFPLEPRHQGTNKLIKQGAYLLESVDDLLENINNYEQNTLFDNKIERNLYKEELKDSSFHDSDLENNKAKLISKLDYSPATIDDIVKFCDLSHRTALILLLELELSGKVCRYYGNKFALINRD